MRTVHCRHGTESLAIEAKDEETIVCAIIRTLKIPRKTLKLVVKGKKIDETEAERLHDEDATTVFFVVGQPLTEEEVTARKAKKEKKMKELEALEMAHQQELQRKEKLAMDHALWVTQEAHRLEEAERLFKEREAARQHQRKACNSVSSFIWAVISAPAPIIRGVRVFVMSIFDPPPAVETEAVLKVRQRDAEAASRERRLESLRSRPGKGKNHTTMGGGG